jgi:hypothetical protein
MALSGVLSEIQKLDFNDDMDIDSREDFDSISFFARFSQRYSVPIRSESDIYRFVDSLQKPQVASLRRQNSLLASAKASAEKAFANAESLLELQLLETRKLSEQRNLLVEKLHTLDLICRQTDQVIQSPPSHPPAEPKAVQVAAEKEAKNDDTVYLLLSAAFRTLEQSLAPDYLSELAEIRDDSRKTSSDRVITMLRLTCERERQTHEKLAELSDRLDQSAADADSAKRESLEVLRMFEDELHFLQQLCYSKDLQSVMFARFGSGFTFDDEMREELARRCASIGSFIDRQLGGPHVGDSPRLFSLSSGESSEPAIREMLLRFDENESVHCRKLADLLISQVLMNDVLRNYCSELSARPRNRSAKKLEELTAEITTLNEGLGTLRKRNARLKQRLRKIYRLTQGQDPTVFLRHKPSAADGAPEPSIPIREHENMQKATNDRITNLEQLLAASREQLTALTAEHATSARQSEEQISRYDGLVAVKDRQIAKLQSKIEKVKAIVGDAQDHIGRLQAESEMLRQQLSQSESKQSVLRADKAKLVDRIAKLEDVNAKGISEIKAKSAEIRVQYEARAAQIGKLRQSIRSLSEEYGKKEREIAQLRADLDAERIESKSLNLQLRSCEERFELEKKTFVSQLSARQVSHDTELDRVAKSAEASLAHFTSQVSDRMAKYLGSGAADPLEGIDLLGSELLWLKKARKSYSALIGDVEDIQRLIKTERTDQIVGAVRKVVEEEEQLQAEVERCREHLERQKQETRKLLRENSNMRGQIAAVGQWENWARRLLMVVRDCRVGGFTGEQLRLALEESLLASATSRVLFFRLKMLRDEKKLLLRFGSGTMAEKGKRSPEWNSILIALICIRRMQKMAGTLPIFLDS